MSCSSRPIIENCSGIGFAAYPAIIGKRVGIMNADNEDWLQNESVEDFNWLRREHSPNWRILEEVIDTGTWEEVLELTDGPTSPQTPELAFELVQL